MSESIRLTNIALEIFGCLIALIIIVSLAVSENHKSKANKFFILTAASVLLTLASDATALIFRGGSGAAAFYLVRISNFGLFSFGYFMALFFTNYLAVYISAKKQVPKFITRFVSAICFIAVLLVVISQFNNMYYYIDENNLYHRQGMFWLSQIIPIVCMTINAAIIIAYRKVLNIREFLLLLSYIVLPVTAMAIQIYLYGLVLLYIAATISLLMIYIGIQANIGKQLKEKELELTKSRVAVMLSQIQPHFLYNALASIKALCSTDPQAASQIVMEFSDYLRGNMDSLSHTKLISFDKELTHVETYLKIEKIRFGDTLNIIYDINARDFSLPSLTLQPIVENAVRYGATKTEDSGTVTIRTEETENGYVITVTDDGVGFDIHEKKDDGRTHIGIENVRERLAAMCGGTLAVDSEPGSGTTAVIFIPKEG